MQNLKTEKNIFLTLNPFFEIDQKKVLQKVTFTHPYFDQDALNNQKLLKEISLKKNRSAKFVSILSFLDPELKNPFFSYGELFGKIIDSPKGKGGFGYDPIFQVKNSNLTLAEISKTERMRISHRTMSTLKMITLLKESKIY